ncbi:hypothetical protein HPB49_008953 [Dermacentor silvarum]|uniref:Uncharacterized protein n=1 Tax=Dermacentor silvarum TaxID=543639 RepID=A0ACB8DYD7_DERSI|nr:hypothetical protein HPB49_008953 [Dermacentor silvarum]
MKRLSAALTLRRAISTAVYAASAVAPDKCYSLTMPWNDFHQVRVLAADGLHPSFEGVALMASHIKQLCFRKSADVASTSWLDHMPSCHAEPPYPGLLHRNY